MSTKPAATPRLQLPQRHQMKIDVRSLDQLLPADHRARIIWTYVEGLDLSPLLARIKAVVGNPGQPAIDPRILLSLWLLATFDGIGSARELDRLTREQLPYEWLCGEVSVNYHTLADFRSQNEELLSGLLTQSVATLLQQGAKLDDIQRLHEEYGIEVYAPVKNAEPEKAKGNDPYQAKPKDAPGVGLWRQRMGTAAAQTIYKRRAQTAEWVNARVRNMGLRQLGARGLGKVRAVALLYALAHNLMQLLLLKSKAAAG